MESMISHTYFKYHTNHDIGNVKIHREGPQIDPNSVIIMLISIWYV